jgi:hypothetical protein
VKCARHIQNRPKYYGDEFHGIIDRTEADQLLANVGEGAYLVRESQRAPDNFTLCLRFDNQTRNYRLFYDNQHYVGEKRFDTIEDLVADGLICMYIDLHAKDYITTMDENVDYDETPYAKVHPTTRHNTLCFSINEKHGSKAPSPSWHNPKHESQQTQRDQQACGRRPMAIKQ